MYAVVNKTHNIMNFLQNDKINQKMFQDLSKNCQNQKLFFNFSDGTESIRESRFNPAISSKKFRPILSDNVGIRSVANQFETCVETCIVPTDKRTRFD